MFCGEREKMRQGKERESGIYIGENKTLLFCFAIPSFYKFECGVIFGL